MTAKNQSSDTVGILGGGQLGSLLIRSLKQESCKTLVYAQSGDEPACAIADAVLIGAKSDSEKLTEFFSQCTSVILESEFYSPEFLKDLEHKSGGKVFPNLNNYEKLFSKEKQKKFFDDNQIPNVSYQLITNKLELQNLNFDGPYMVKISHGGYDGKGNFFIESKDELLAQGETLSSGFEKELLVEKFITIKEEFASMLIKNKTSEVILPPCKTVQRDAVCHLVRFPFDCSLKVTEQINSIMEKISKALPGEGIYAYEFFLTEEDEVLLNEAAPRVHNSYHFSIEAFDKSQFDLCRDAALNKELTLPIPRVPFATMVNILGSDVRENYQLEFNEKADYPFAVHMYGKTKMTKGRKMGHITFYGDNDSFEYANQVSKEYRL